MVKHLKIGKLIFYSLIENNSMIWEIEKIMKISRNQLLEIIFNRLVMLVTFYVCLQ